MLSKKLLILAAFVGLVEAQSPPFMLFAAPIYSAADIAATLGYIPGNVADTSYLLRKAANLSDLASTPISRTNLGLGIADMVQFKELSLLDSTSNTTNPQTVATLTVRSTGSTNFSYATRLVLQTQNANGNLWPAGIAAANSLLGSNVSDLAFYTATAGPTLNEVGRMYSTGAMSITGAFTATSLTTGAPTSGTAGVWKTGINVTAACILSTTNYIQLDVGGTLYKMATCQ